MKSASESKSAARRLVACAAVALVAPAPAAWAQNSQRADHGTGAPILSPPDTSAQDSGSGMSNGNTAAPPPATRMNDARGKRSHARPHVRTKPGGPSAAGNGGSGGSAGMGGVGAGAGRSSGATGSGGGGAGGTGSAGSSGY
ncbi:TPA: hypothetical protein QDB15_003226 [Burkholderia vietnamiensis]|uniref:Uncharacterized protein n=1 Tax=Burkholderia vietnamiensis TaxID=60552 RepID=A0A132DZV1_BURVI|nr:hypothetical protein [Burkholderia vietnamiensis]KVR89060.1 hypothetical protein WK26_29505 [Burkholderia vietnamiensis]KVS16810.1 hypothetical protein WK32_26205 [Burkholderia vietnamiensis]KVS37299.1 hypothetical protein WK35_32545 [Burkholderia vietnamiensis]MBR8148351.1 hypothetical protein [Burkholderia vietnamiensis]MBR8230113.1 hypothetical protein [Burkholderia vietnamiensis]